MNETKSSGFWGGVATAAFVVVIALIWGGHVWYDWTVNHQFGIFMYVAPEEIAANKKIMLLPSAEATTVAQMQHDPNIKEYMAVDVHLAFKSLSSLSDQLATTTTYEQYNSMIASPYWAGQWRMHWTTIQTNTTGDLREIAAQCLLAPDAGRQGLVDCFDSLIAYGGG